jgi:predicted nucleic acid-binding protein
LEAISSQSKPRDWVTCSKEVHCHGYLLSADTAKADRAEELLAIGGVISVQELNEFAAVASRKLGMS